MGSEAHAPVAGLVTLSLPQGGSFWTHGHVALTPASVSRSPKSSAVPVGTLKAKEHECDLLTYQWEFQSPTLPLLIFRYTYGSLSVWCL